jgi:anti-anti-sigma factor
VDQLTVTAHPSSDRYVVKVSGELDFYSVRTLREHFSDFDWTRCPDVIVDLRGLEFIDAAGLHELIWIERLSRAAGRRASFIPGSPQTQKIFLIASLLDRFEWVEAPE